MTAFISKFLLWLIPKAFHKYFCDYELKSSVEDTRVFVVKARNRSEAYHRAIQFGNIDLSSHPYWISTIAKLKYSVGYLVIISWADKEQNDENKQKMD